MKRLAIAAVMIAALVGLAGTASATPAGTIDWTTVAPLTVQAIGTDGVSTTGSPVTLGVKVVAAVSTTFPTAVLAVRDPSGANVDCPGQTNYVIGTAQQQLTCTKTFTAAGTYTYWLATFNGSTWTNWAPTTTTFTLTSPNPQPTGAAGSWRYLFGDEFSGTAVDTTKWSFQSTAESCWSSAPLGTANPGNQQLEFDQPGNASVAGGLLTLTAKPDSIDACGQHFAWSSAVLNTSPSYAFHYGFIEVRAQLPSPKGFWPAFWTWQASGNTTWTETDVFEFYSDTHTNLYLTQHSGAGGSTVYHPTFDSSTGMHVYGADIESTGTDFYVDGTLVFHAAGVSTGNTNINVDNFVYSVIPPAAGSTAAMMVDYVRAWQH